MKKTIKFLLIAIAMINGAKISAQCYANAGPDQYFCCGGTTTLSATFNATNIACTCTNVSYVWTPTTGLSNPNIPNPTATISNVTYVVCITSYTGKHCAFVCCQACDTVKIHVTSGCCKMTGIDESNNGAYNIVVYPNPAKTNITIDGIENLNNPEFNITDITGRIIWNKENVTSSKLEINVSTFPRGIYFVKGSENGKEVYMTKIIIE